MPTPCSGRRWSRRRRNCRSLSAFISFTPIAAISTKPWQWREADISARNPTENPARFALYTLKALAFVPLRRDEKDRAQAKCAALAELDPSGQVGWPVIATLAKGF